MPGQNRSISIIAGLSPFCSSFLYASSRILANITVMN